MKLITDKGEIREALADFMPFIPRAKLTRAAAQVMASGVYTTMLWDTEQFDTDTMHDLVTNTSRITIKTAGVYKIVGSISWAGIAQADYREINILYNGTSTVARDGRAAVNNAGVSTDMGCECTVECAVGDYFELRGYQNTGGNLNAGPLLTTFFEAVLVGPGFNSVRSKPVIQYVTAAQFAALTPIDGDEVYLIADAANGVVWHLRYNAGSASSYKWEYLGGGEMNARVLASETTTATWVDLTTVGPQIVVPRAGDYFCMYGALLYNANAAGTAAAGIYYNGALQTSIITTIDNSIGSVQVGDTQQGLLTGLAAGTTVKMQYWSSGGFVSTFTNRWLTLIPRRIS